MEIDGDSTVVSGTAPNGEVIVRFGQRTSTDADGSVHGEIVSIMQGRARVRYTAHADGTFTVEENGLPAEQDAVDAARRAYDDLEPAGAPAVEGLVSPKNLTAGQEPLARSQTTLLNQGRQTAGMAASCGGGDCGGPVHLVEPAECKQLEDTIKHGGDAESDAAYKKLVKMTCDGSCPMKTPPSKEALITCPNAHN